MRVMLDGTEVQLNARDLPAFSYAIHGDLDLNTIKGNSSTTFKVPASNNARVIGGSPVMSEARASDRTLRIGIGSQDYHVSRVRALEIDRDVIKYVAIGGNASWMDTLKKAKINELNLGDSDELLAPMQRSSWTDYDRTDIYPVINYGYLGSRAVGFDVGVKYLRPGIRVWKILRQVFQDAGYTLEVKGGFGRYWKKLFIPNTVKDVVATPYWNDYYSLVLLHQGPKTFTPDPILPMDPNATTIPVDFVSYDPSGSVTGISDNLKYLAQVDAKVNVQVRFTITRDPGEVVRMFVQVSRNGIRQSTHEVPGYNIVGDNDVTMDLGDFDFDAGSTWNVKFVHAFGGVSNTITLDRIGITYTPKVIAYQEGIGFNLASCLPRMSAMDLLKSIGAMRCLAITTNDLTKVVTLEHYEDYVKTTLDGRDLRGREDHSRPPQRNRPKRPIQVDFKFMHDSEDERLVFFLEDRLRELGSKEVVNADGESKEQTVKVEFAPTVMDYVFDNGFLVPTMVKKEGDFQVDDYARTQRILIHDGVATGDWTHDGVDQTEYPDCYFAVPNGRFNLSFDREEQWGDTGPGVVETLWREKLRRFLDSDILEIELRLFDDELIDIDFSRPVCVHDGHEPGWYLFQAIKQKRFGTDETTLCELIQY